MNQQSRSSRGSPIFGVFVLATGVVLLLNVLDVLPWEIWLELWRWWPLFLVLAGVGILLKWANPLVMTVLTAGALSAAILVSWAVTEGRIGLYDIVTSYFSEPVDGATSAKIDVDFGAGTLTVSALPLGSSVLMDADFEDREDSVRTRVERTGDDVEIELRSRTGFNWFGPSGGQREWDLRVNPDIPVRLSIDGGAGTYDLDLSELFVQNIDLNIGASDLDLVLPADSGLTEVSIDAGAASIEVTVPVGVAAKIRVESGLSSIDIDESRFPKVNGDHVSAGYDAAESRVDIVINAGVSSITVR